MAAAVPPRVGLIVGDLDGLGGLELAAGRHVRLLRGEVDVIPIALASGKKDSQWHGEVERFDFQGSPAYRIVSSELQGDKVAGQQHVAEYALAAQLIRLVERERLELLHVFGAFKLRPLLGAYAAVACGIPLVLSFRGVDLDVRVFGPHLPHLQTAVRAARVCVCMNRRAQRLLAGLLRPEGEIFVSPNSIDPADFSPGPLPDLGLEGPVIGCLGEFRRFMGVDFLLRAFDRLCAERPVTLLLIGALRPEEAYYYSRLLDGLSHPHLVVRAGLVPHARVLSYLELCDVMAFPSVSDASPNKVLESMLAGRAIVASDIGGIPDLIRHGVDGVLVDGRDSKALAAALAELLADPERRRSYGESARQRALEEFAPERARETCRRYYREAGLRL